MSGIQITLKDTGKPELMAWAEANGLDPNRITMESGCLPEVWNGELVYGYVPPGEKGGDLIDEMHDRLVIVPRFARVTPLPAGIGRPIEVSEQLQGHECPICSAAREKVAS